MNDLKKSFKSFKSFPLQQSVCVFCVYTTTPAQGKWFEWFEDSVQIIQIMVNPCIHVIRKQPLRQNDLNDLNRIFKPFKPFPLSKGCRIHTKDENRLLDWKCMAAQIGQVQVSDRSSGIANPNSVHTLPSIINNNSAYSWP